MKARASSRKAASSGEKSRSMARLPGASIYSVIRWRDHTRAARRCEDDAYVSVIRKVSARHFKPQRDDDLAIADATILRRNAVGLDQPQGERPDPGVGRRLGKNDAARQPTILLH